MMLQCGPITIFLSLLEKEERLPSLHVDVGIEVRRLSHLGSYRGQLWFESSDWGLFVRNVGSQSAFEAVLHDISRNFELFVNRDARSYTIKIVCSSPQSTAISFRQEYEWEASEEEVAGLCDLLSSIA
jgi:hypothetical protein